MYGRSGSGYLFMGVLASSALIAPAVSHAKPWYFHADHVIGTSLDMVCVAADEITAWLAASAARAEIARLDPILSNWRSDSEVTKLNQSHGMSVSDDLFNVLQIGERWRALTQGAFDIRIGKLLTLWREAAQAGETPYPDHIAASIAGFSKPVIFSEGNHVTRPEGVSFALDGIAKGYILDAAVSAARKATPALQGLMIDIGGDIRVWRDASEKGDWPIGIASAQSDEDNAAPRGFVALKDNAVAVSGRSARDFSFQQNNRSHIISPLTGQPADHTANTAVIAPSAADADILATAFAVMSPDEAIKLANRLPNVQVSLIAASGKEYASPGWEGVEFVQATPEQSIAAKGEAWPDGFAVTVDYGIPMNDLIRYRKQYVAIWITNSKKKTVRTVALLGRWRGYQDNNYIWWRAYGNQAEPMLNTVARATRLPGRYKVKWDGKDDNGRMVPQGRYTLHIEAVRQFGTHSYASIPLKLGTESLEESIAGKEEFGDVAITYGKQK